MNTILTAHQPAYLPWIGLFHKIAIANAYVYLDNIQFEKNSFINRNKIKTANGPIWLTVPILLKGHMSKTIKEMKINNIVNWQTKHLKSIEMNYKSTSYFNQYIGFFRDCYKREWTHLSDLNEYMLKWFLNILNIKVKYYKMSEIGFEGRKSDLVLDMCKKLSADLYIFGALGRDYVKEENFTREDIKIYFQNYNHPVYQQLYVGFISHLSIVDLLFNVGAERALDVIMQGNISKKELRRMFPV